MPFTCILVFAILQLVVARENLKVEWGTNFKEEGKLHHNVDRVWVVTKSPMPDFEKLKLETRQLTAQPQICANVSTYHPPRDEPRHIMEEKKRIVLLMRMHCDSASRYINLIAKKEKNFIRTIQQKIDHDLRLMVPTLPKDRPKRGVMATVGKTLAKVLLPTIGSVAMLAMEKLTSWLHRKRHRAIEKGISAINSQNQLQADRLHQFHSEFLMYGKYNTQTLNSTLALVNQLQQNQQNFTRFLTEDFTFYTNVMEGRQRYAFEVQTYMHLIKESNGEIYKEVIRVIDDFLNGVATLSRGFLPRELITPRKLLEIESQVQQTISRTHPEYQVAIQDLSDYYDMRLVSFGVDLDGALVITFPILMKHQNRQTLALYQIETVPVPVPDANQQMDTYTHIAPDRPYLAVEKDWYIQLRIQELRMCKNIHFQYYCEEPFVVKHKSRPTCSSALFYDMDEQVLGLCQLKVLYNATVTPTVLDGGEKILLANLDKDKKLKCASKGDLTAPLPTDQYMTINRDALCHCDIDADLTHVLQTITGCTEDEEDPMKFLFIINQAFYGVFETLLQELNYFPPNNSFILQQQKPPPFPVYLPPDQHLLQAAHLSLQDLEQYLTTNLSSMSKQGWPSWEEWTKMQQELSLVDKMESKIFTFIMAVITIVVIVCVGILAWKNQMIHNYVSGLTLALVPKAEAVYEFKPSSTKMPTTPAVVIHRMVCQDSWLAYLLAALIFLGTIALVYKWLRRYSFTRGLIFTNKCELYLLISQGCYYVPVKVMETTGVMPFFKVTDTMDATEISLEKNFVWDQLTINWSSHIIYRDRILVIPSKVFVPLPYKWMTRNLLQHKVELHLMVKQGFNWIPVEVDPIEKPAP